MSEADAGPPCLFLQPGDFRFGAAPLRLATLLGSCVAVTVWHPARRVGGMCHIVFPLRPAGHTDVPQGGFADEAFVLFDEAIQRSGCRAGEFQAKLFGGGRMLPGEDAAPDVGTRNVAAVRRLLAERRLPIAAEDTGGSGHRKLVFDLESGVVTLRFAELAGVGDDSR